MAKSTNPLGGLNRSTELLIHHHCVYCHREKTGRWIHRTRSMGWSQGLNKPIWSCYDCTADTSPHLPQELDMPTPTTTKTTLVTPSTALSPVVRAKVQKEGMELYNPLKNEIVSLTIETPEQYELADGLLSRIREARRRWAAKLNPITEPLARVLKEAKTAMDGAKTLLNEVDRPLEQGEMKVRAAMRDFKIEEARQLREAEEEQARIQQEIEVKAQQEAAARTTPQRQKLARQRENLERLSESVNQEAPVKTVVTNSTTRTRPNWRIKDMNKFMMGVADQTLPGDVVMVNSVVMNRHFKDNPEEMKAWPGIEIYDDVIIVGR